MGPLEGLLFCCTAMTADRRQELERKILELGGTYSLDLMSHINYLIVGDRETAKYKYCIKNRYDITFLTPQAVDIYYRDYKKGRTTKINDHKLPIFDDFNMCIAHIKSDELMDITPEKLGLLKRTITQHHGKFSDSLTANHSILVTNVTSGKRYSKALEWGVPVVHPRFIFDSVARGAAVDPSDYDIQKYPDYPTIELAKKEDPKVLRIKKNVQVWDSIMKHTDLKIKEPEVEEEEKHKEIEKKSVIFENIKFRLVSFNDHQLRILSDIITQNSGSIVKRGVVDYILIPFGDDHHESLGMGTVKTEWLIERSIYYNKLTDDEWSDPVPPVNFSESFNISLSGFKGIELLHLTKLCKHLGFTINENFNSKISLLVINISIFKAKLPQLLFYNDSLTNCSFNQINYISTKNKVLAAKNWKIPIVSANFIFETLSLSKDDTVSYPDIKKLSWCVFCPRNCSTEFYEYWKRKDIESSSVKSDSLNLPSPKKIKRKFGKLVTSSKLDFEENEATDSNDNEVIDDLNFDLDIGYDAKRPKVQ